MVKTSNRILSDNWFATDSLSLARSISKRHEQVFKDITHIIGTEPNQVDNFQISTYLSAPPISRKLPRYIITKKGYERLVYLYQQKAEEGYRKELHFGYMLMDALSEMTEIHMQFFVNPYRIDFYLPEFKLAVEYDENYHQSSKQKYLDKHREEEIKKKIPGISFLRVNEGCETESINLILNLINQLHMCNCLKRRF